MTKQIQCWQCGNTLTVLLPLSRRETCDACNADQHVCRLCKHYAANLSDQCNEDRAEAVTDKERANFCDYFDPNPTAYQGGGDPKQNAAKAKLDALFGDGSSDSEIGNSPEDKNEAARKALEDLFSPPNTKK